MLMTFLLFGRNFQAIGQYQSFQTYQELEINEQLHLQRMSLTNQTWLQV